jgi:branched-chain amino acid transport system substrate-binding protein
LIGPLCSAAAIAAAVEAAAAGVLLIAPAAPHPLVTRDQTGKPRPTVFQIAYTPDWQAYHAARFGITTLNMSRTALLEPGGDRYGSSLASFFTTHYQAMGGTVVFTATLEAATTDLTQVLAESYEASAQLLYVPGSAPHANVVVGQLHQLQQSGDLMGLTVLGSDSWYSPSLDLDAIEGSYFPVQYTPLNPAPEIQNWRATYKSTFAVEPDSLAALGFDSANVLVEGIRHAASRTPDDVAASLESLEFEGVTGAFQFDVHHNPRKTINFLQVRDQSLVLYEEP